MKNTFGTAVSLTLFGESHGAAVGAVIDGLAPGIPVDEAEIGRHLSLRRPFGAISTARREADEFRIVSGVFRGRTTGTPLTILIPNTDAHSADYEANRSVARPGHADYTAFCKYHGFEDYRGGGHFSGRLTAALVAAGAVAGSALQAKGISLGTHIARCGGIADAPFTPTLAELDLLRRKPFATLSEERGAAMQAAIEQAAAEGDSVGGVLETAVLGMPPGVGEPWFDSAEGMLAHMLFSIPGIKGVEFGDGFALSELRGSAANDAFRAEEGRIRTETNHNGGINGGITNGMPLILRCAVKPTPSIRQKQQTVDFFSGENTELTLGGRHDPAFIHRARIAVDSAVAFALCDLLVTRFGTDFLRGDAK